MTEEILAVDTEPVKTAQAPAPGTEPTDWMTLNDEFRNGAPDSVKDLLTKKGYTHLGQFFDSYNELEKFKGIGKHLVIPEAEDAEEWNDVYNQLGRPETHDKYEYTYEGDVEISEELTGQFKEYAHSLGLTQNQFNKIVNFQLDAVAAQTEAYNIQDEEQKNTKREEEVATLKIKLGKDGVPCSDEVYKAKVVGARIIADSLGIYQTLEANGLASNPAIIEMLDTIVSRTAEDVIAPQTSAATTKSPIEERDDIMKNPVFKDKFARGRKELMARYMELNQIIANSGQGSQPNSR